MNNKRKELWVKELYNFNKKTAEEISIMMDIEIEEVNKILSLMPGGKMTKEEAAEKVANIKDAVNNIPTLPHLETRIPQLNNRSIPTLSEIFKGSMDNVEFVESVTTEENKPSSNRDLIKHLYLDEDKSYEEIANITGMKLSTVKNYVSQGGYCKTPRKKRSHKTASQNESSDSDEVHHEPEHRKYEPDPVPIVNDEDKPYEVIDGDIVFYKGKLCRLLSKEELREMLRKDLHIVNKQNKKKK